MTLKADAEWRVMGRRTEKQKQTAVAAAAAVTAVALGAALSGCGSTGDRANAANAADAAKADANRRASAGIGGGAPSECPGAKASGDSARRQLRGMWIATVANVDWPRDTDHSVERQKADYRRMLDRARALNMNAVFVQVRPNGDAFYKSPYEPWSQWLTGTQGKDPGYDVLKFLLQEAHNRDLEFHAWFNPYRLSRQADVSKLHPSSPGRKNPGWVFKYGGGLWYNPGLPQVRQLVTNAVLDVVRKYDIDAVHFDDYFYPYPGEGGKINDGASYKAYGKGMSLAAWRRNNVDTMVSGLSQRIHQAKPWVRFGISPFGVWRNSSTDRAGSKTQALQSYDDIYADTRKWVKKGWIDYITPQLYWPIGDPRADYRTLVAWWARQVAGTKVQLTIGQAGYRVGEDKTWKRADELSRHLSYNKQHAQVRGDVFFSAKDMVGDKLGFATRLRKDHYGVPAIAPPTSGGRVPAAVRSVTASSGGKGVRVQWRASEATSYAVYRVTGKGQPCAAVDPAKLLVTVRGGAIIDPTAKAGATYTYYVTALDRTHHESAPARGATVTVRGG